jgi:hypothetical protein
MAVEYGFKAREINDKSIPTKEEMFHIPFEMRHKVQDYRYSNHGIPSIYLGQSIYDCYIELNSPSLDDFWVSLFAFSHINLIDLTLSSKFYDISVLIDYVKKDEEKYYANLDRFVDDVLLWPLIMACSIPCKYPEDSFQQEYIIPQILYQFCSEFNKFIGIKYMSTKTKYVNQHIHQYAMVNYALPAHDVRRSGYCPKLASQLALTAPIKISQIQNIDKTSENSTSANGFPILSNMHESLKNDDIILMLDKMTVYFDKLVQSFIKDKNADLIKPLYGWSKA